MYDLERSRVKMTILCGKWLLNFRCRKLSENLKQSVDRFIIMSNYISNKACKGKVLVVRRLYDSLNLGDEGKKTFLNEEEVLEL